MSQKPKSELVTLPSIVNKLWIVFDVFFNNSCEQTFINLGICLNKNVSLMLHIKFLGFSIFDILKPNFTKHILRFLLLYRTPSSSVTLFFDRVRETIHPELHNPW